MFLGLLGDLRLWNFLLINKMKKKKTLNVLCAALLWCQEKETKKENEKEIKLSRFMILVVSKEIVDDLKKNSCIDGKFSDSFTILMAFFLGGGENTLVNYELPCRFFAIRRLVAPTFFQFCLE